MIASLKTFYSSIFANNNNTITSSSESVESENETSDSMETSEETPEKSKPKRQKRRAPTCRKCFKETNERIPRKGRLEKQIITN